MLYGKLCDTYQWERFEHVDDGASSFYWGVLAYTAAMQQDEQRVKAFMQTYQARVMPNHDYPIYCADSGWMILACGRMERYYEEKMKDVDPLNLVPMDDMISFKAAGP